jgi:outer membrane receptor protein involved in Fe transport
MVRRRLQRLARRLAAAAVLGVLLAGMGPAAWAQNGKLAGTVTDGEDGQPLPGVNVVLLGTQQGAATKADGSYAIIGISPGTYRVRFSLVGYGRKVVEDVRITSNRTRTLNIEMSAEVLEGDEVVVQAQRPVVEADQTASRTLFTGEEVQQLPVSSLDEVISNTAKSYEGFVRGSRRFGTKTVLEGIDISDEFNQANSITGRYNTRLGYGNTVRNDQVRSANSVFNLNASAVEEVSVSTGATPASAPSGSGGVVSVTLAEGRGAFTGNASVRVAPQINRPGPDSLSFYPESQVEAYFAERQSILEAGNEALGNLYTWERGLYDVATDPEITADFALSGGVTENFGIAVAGQFFQTEGYRPNEFDRRVNAQVKASYNVSPKTKLTAIGLFEDRGLWGGWNNRNYSELWKYYLQGTAQDDGGSWVGSLQGRRVLGDNAFVTVQYYRKFARTRYGYPDDNGNRFVDLGEDGDFINFLKTDNIVPYNWVGEGPPEEKMFYGGPFPPARSDNVTQPRGEPYRAAQPLPYYEDSERVTNAFKVDYSNQVTPHHLIEVGTQLKLLSFDYAEARSELFEFDFTLNNDLNNNDDDIPDIEPFAPSTWQRNPWELSFYVSDRIEYGSLIVNAGLRTEFVDRDARLIEDHFFPFRRDTVTVDGRVVARNFFERGDEVPIDVFWEPRIGVSHPISDRAAVYFSYARSQDLVPYGVLYDFYDGNHSSNQFLVFQDPAQDPITSNDYELGVQWEFLEGWGLDVNAYARSVDNYGRAVLTAVNRVPEGEDPLDLARSFGRHQYETSAGYADIRGIELQVQRRLLDLAENWALGLTGSYTFSTVETNNYTSNVTRFQADDPSLENNQLPFDNTENFEHFPQGVTGGPSTITSGFNRRHRGLLRAVAEVPFGITVGVDGRAESGVLFRKVIGTDPRDREFGTGPANYRLDLRLQKQFDLPQGYAVRVFLDVTNLTDRDNVLAFNSRAPDGAERFQRTGNPGELLVLQDGSPVYGTARNIYFGTRVQF